MFHGLLAAGAFASVLSFALLPLPLALGVVAVSVLILGFVKARNEPTALIPTALTIAGLLMIALSVSPASAATATHKPLTVLELPTAMPSLALPAAPATQTIVVAAPSPETSVALPLSEWMRAASSLISSVLLAVLAFAMRKAPMPIVWLVKMYGQQKLVDMAVNMGINAVPGAAKGVPMSIDVGSKVLATALQWAVVNVPGIILKIAGGEDGLKAKIFAALHLEADASAADLGVNTTG